MCPSKTCRENLMHGDTRLQITDNFPSQWHAFPHAHHCRHSFYSQRGAMIRTGKSPLYREVQSSHALQLKSLRCQASLARCPVLGLLIPQKVLIETLQHGSCVFPKLYAPRSASKTGQQSSMFKLADVHGNFALADLPCSLSSLWHS